MTVLAFVALPILVISSACNFFVQPLQIFFFEDPFYALIMVHVTTLSDIFLKERHGITSRSSVLRKGLETIDLVFQRTRAMVFVINIY